MTTPKAQTGPSDRAKSSCGKPISIDAIFPSSSIEVSALADTGQTTATENAPLDPTQPMSPKAETRAMADPAPQTLSRNPWQVETDRSKLIPIAGLSAVGVLVCVGLLYAFLPGRSDDTPVAQTTPTEPQAQSSVTTVSDIQNTAAPISEATARQTEPVAVAQDAAPAERVGPTSFADTMMDKMTANTLAVLRQGAQTDAAATAAPAAPVTAVQRTALYELLMTAVAQGQSQDYIDQLVNGAHARQEITVPESLIGPDGRVDTATLLAVFVGN